MNPHDLLRIAYQLVREPGRGRPREAGLWRAVSSAYYALFHALANCCAYMLAGSTRANRSQQAWRQVYRALEHGHAKNQCINRSVMNRFPPEVQNFGEAFVNMQLLRHTADYDPDPEASFIRAEVLQRIEDSEEAIRELENAPIRDRRAFAIHVLLRIREQLTRSGR